MRRYLQSLAPRMVLVMEGEGDPVPRPVLVGLKTRTQAEILYGLEPGETVVTGTSQGAMPAMSGPPRGGMRSAPRFR